MGLEAVPEVESLARSCEVESPSDQAICDWLSGLDIVIIVAQGSEVVRIALNAYV